MNIIKKASSKKIANLIRIPVQSALKDITLLVVLRSFLVVSSFPSSVFPFSVSRFPTTFSTSEGNPLVD